MERAGGGGRGGRGKKGGKGNALENYTSVSLKAWVNTIRLSRSPFSSRGSFSVSQHTTISTTHAASAHPLSVILRLSAYDTPVKKGRKKKKKNLQTTTQETNTKRRYPHHNYFKTRLPVLLGYTQSVHSM